MAARTRKRFTGTTNSDHDQPVAANLLDRQVTAVAPNQRRVGDTTEFVIGDSGKLYLATILDLYSRFIVGWAVSALTGSASDAQALEAAIKRRCPEAGLMHQSDQGCTHPSEDYQKLPAAHGITCSMSVGAVATTMRRWRASSRRCRRTRGPLPEFRGGQGGDPLLH